MSNTEALPPLPEPTDCTHGPCHFYTGDQMRAYALTALAQPAASGEPAEPLSALRGIASLPDGVTSEQIVKDARDGWGAASPGPVALSDERIDAIADLIVKGMPDGIQGFLKSWGWRQFSRALLEDCAGHYRAPPLVAPEAWQALAETASRTLERAERREARNAAIEPAAWFCEWFNADGSPEWDQYHDRTDPLPADDEWEDRPPDRVTPLYATAQPAPAQPGPVAGIDYAALMKAAEARKYRPGTGPCVAFKNGAEWQAAQPAPALVPPDVLRKALEFIQQHCANIIRTNSRDRDDWAEDMAYVGKVAREALTAAPDAQKGA